MVSTIFYLGSLAYGCAIAFLSLGLTLTYLTTKVPNFAHATIASVASYILLLMVEGYKWNPYAALPLAMLGGLITSISQYLLILRPLAKRGSSIISLMISTLAYDIILVAALNIIADAINEYFGIAVRNVTLISKDIYINGFRGAIIFSPIMLVVFTILLHLLLTRTKFGIAMRASIENPELAEILGINVFKTHLFAWSISGIVAGLAGGLLALITRLNPAMSYLLIVSVFAGSIAGGLQSLFGAVAGGLLVGLAEKWVTQLLASMVSISILSYEKVVSLGIVIFVLLVFPEGLASIPFNKLTALRKKR